MAHPPVKGRQQSGGVIRDDGILRVGTGESPYRIERLPSGNDEDLDRGGDFAREQHGARVPIHLADRREDAGLQVVGVGAGPGGGGARGPETGDHRTPPIGVLPGGSWPTTTAQGCTSHRVTTPLTT